MADCAAAAAVAVWRGAHSAVRVLVQVSTVVRNANRALDFNIQPEADIDAALELYAKLQLLFAPNKQVMEIVADDTLGVSPEGTPPPSLASSAPRHPSHH